MTDDVPSETTYLTALRGAWIRLHLLANDGNRTSLVGVLRGADAACVFVEQERVGLTLIYKTAIASITPYTPGPTLPPPAVGRPG